MNTFQSAPRSDYDDSFSITTWLARRFPPGRTRFLQTILIGLLAIMVAISLARPLLTSTGTNNLSALQAQAFLHKQLAVSTPAQDVAVFHGRYYDSFPPFPALLLMPFVAVLGLAATNPVAVCLLATLASVRLFVLILRRLALPTDTVIWLSGAFFLGTAYWYCLRDSNGVWCFNHVISVLCLLLAIYEALGKGRGLWVGLWAGCAFLSRQMTLYSVVFLGVVVVLNSVHQTQAQKIKQIAGMAVSLAVCVAFYMVLNKARFGSPFDTGYGDLQLGGAIKEQVERYGLFSIAYLPHNFATLFLQGFHIDFQQPDGPLQAEGLKVVGMNKSGTALTSASPFVLAALWARGRPWFIGAGWATILLTMVSGLLYYNNGYVQYNAYRFSMDFLPVLMVFVALGTRHVPPWAWKSAVVLAIGLNVLAQVVVPLLQHLH